MKLRALPCLFIIACLTMALVGCGSRSSVSQPKVKTSIACGPSYVLALRSDGSLWAWGDNSGGDLGLGPSPLVSESTATRVGVANDWVGHRLRNRLQPGLEDGWQPLGLGRNDSGQLGLGNTNNRYTPTEVGTPTTGRPSLAAMGKAWL